MAISKEGEVKLCCCCGCIISSKPYKYSWNNESFNVCTECYKELEGVDMDVDGGHL